ncbi:MAG: mucoidy inhibitor MuiA family protein, partial [Crocinitomicaceae bacterium]
MKRIIAAWVLGGMIFQAGATEKEIVKSTLTEVTVYSQGAQLHHKANFNVKVGVTEIIIEGISPYIDPRSIQVKATGNVVILDSKYSTFYPQPTAVSVDGIPLKIKKDIKLLEDSLKIIGFDIQEIQDEIDVLNATKNILSNNGVIRGQGKVNDSLNLLKQAVDYYSMKMVELNKKLLLLNKKKQERVEKKRGMDERLQAYRNYENNGNYNPQENAKPIPRVTITVSSKELVTGKLNLSYVVSNAGWTPYYDLRSEASTGKLSLTYKAQVYQNTGLDWNEVKLNISTNNPRANKTKPELNPWYIDYTAYRQVTEKKSKMEYLTETTAIPQAAFNQGFTLNEDVFKDAMTADQFTTVVHHLIAAEFKI